MNTMLQVACVLFLSCGTSLAAATKGPTTRTAHCLVGQPYAQTLAGRTYAYVPAQTTYADVRTTIEKSLATLTKGISESKMSMDGPMIFVYKGAMGDPSKPFTLEMGVSVSGNPEPAGEVKVRKLDEFKCITFLYTGSVNSLGVAYEKCMPQIMKAGHQLTGETREHYIYWEKPDSPNNVIMISVGIK